MRSPGDGAPALSVIASSMAIPGGRSPLLINPPFSTMILLSQSLTPLFNSKHSSSACSLPALSNAASSLSDFASRSMPLALSWSADVRRDVTWDDTLEAVFSSDEEPPSDPPLSLPLSMLSTAE